MAWTYADTVKGFNKETLKPRGISKEQIKNTSFDAQVLTPKGSVFDEKDETNCAHSLFVPQLNNTVVLFPSTIRAAIDKKRMKLNDHIIKNPNGTLNFRYDTFMIGMLKGEIFVAPVAVTAPVAELVEEF